MNGFRRLGASLILAGLGIPLSPAFSQTDGQFTLTGSFTYSYDQLQHGSTTFTAGSLEGGDIVSSSRSPLSPEGRTFLKADEDIPIYTRPRSPLFPEGQTFLKACAVFSEESPGGLNLKAPCTFTEAQEDGGDQLFAVAIRKQGDIGDVNRGGTGHADLVGGTGKYADITGHCSYETRYLSASTAATTWDCTWSQS